MRAALQPELFIGRSPDELNLNERWALVGKWIAIELYSPQTLPLRVIEAIGNSAADCAAQLSARGLNPAGYEFQPLFPPY